MPAVPEPTLSDVQDMLDRGMKAQALQTIDVILTNNPTADGWALAARIVDSAEDKIKLLTKALELDPNHFDALQQATALGLDVPSYDPGKRRRDNAQNPTQISLPPLDDDEQQFDTDRVTREDGKTVYQEGVFEMLWDCKFCGTKKLLGKTHKFCPVCGAQQDAEWRYYPSDAEKVAVKDHRFVGADKMCPNCSSLNTADAEFCTRCGAPQSAASVVKAQAARTAAALTGEGAPAAALGFMTEDLDARQMAEKYGKPTAPQAAPRPRWQIFAMVGVVIAILAAVAFAIFAKRDASGFVSAFDWERTITLDRLTAVNDSRECPAPSGAYNVSRNYEQVGSRSVPDGQSCYSQQVDQGDGTFRQERVCETTYRDEPVMGYMCYYTINVWVPTTSAVSAGTKANSLVWPATNASNCFSLGCERESGRREAYTITITGDGGTTYKCEVPLELWQQVEPEDTFTFKVRVVGGGIDCGSLVKTN